MHTRKILRNVESNIEKLKFGNGYKLFGDSTGQGNSTKRFFLRLLLFGYVQYV